MRATCSTPLLALVALAVATSGPSVLCAQDGQVSYRFQGAALEVQLRTGGAPGELELVDGGAERVTVTDLTGAGGPSIALKDGILNLRHGSTAPARYRVVVSPNARLEVIIDGRRVVSAAPGDGARQLIWSWRGSRRLDRGRAEPSARAAPIQAEPRRLLTFSVSAWGGALVADSVDLAHPERVRALKILVGADRFSVSGDRSVSFGFDEPTRWGVITPRAADVEVTVSLPADVDLFKVRVGDQVIWEYEDGRSRALCEPVAEITSAEGGTLWVFTPQSGRLECAAGGKPLPA